VLGFALFCGASAAPFHDFDYLDHYEFEASLHAPYRADANQSREFELQFHFPGADAGTVAAWRVDIISSNRTTVRTLRGESALNEIGDGTAKVVWSERDPANVGLAYGFYKARMQAYPLNPLTERSFGYGPLDQRVDRALLAHRDEIEEQSWDIQVGDVAPPRMPVFAHLPTGNQPASGSGMHVQGNASIASVTATGGLPYTVYLGNLHSQTNLSDGGGPLSTCVSEQNPQSGAGSPTDAYTYAMNDGLDFLMTSEHNHMFDGSTSTNASANPTTAKNLYQSGQTMRDSFNSAHPNFLALAGLEWGVISNGGHLNIFNTPKLLEWEYNSSNQLIGDIYTAKGDYASLYTLMKTNGWIGQFNHPATTGQFVIGSTALAYSADGDQAMVLCEVMNSSAFSHNTTETETSLNSYESACNILLEAGYHVAFSSDQDNHCANWGASYTNRTGVLLPNGQALNQANFVAALQARHVFATYDKTAQLILTTSGGHVMGDRFNNSGALTLTANYAPGTGRSASQVQIIQGVPGSNGAVSTLASTATTTITPTSGDHFYYAKVTQDNGTLLFSAPVWVTQGAATADFSMSAAPTSASVTRGSSTSDTITITPTNGFTGSVALSASGLPSGVTASFSPTSATSSSTLTLNASSTATTGPATVTITGTSGSLTHSTTLNLTVNAATSSIPRYDHVIVVIEENTSESSVIGNTAQAPYINSLASAGANFTQSYAVTHPSQPNYLAFFSGSTQGVTDDTCPQSFSANNLGNQLITAGYTFAGYSETMPSNGYTGCTSGTSGYARKHNPWSDFTDLAASTNLAYTSFPTDFTTLPTVSFVIPNLCDDMHDCSITTGDTWLKNNLDAYVTWAKTHNSLLVLTWDEDDSTTSANQIATVFVGANVKPGNYTETINHYSVLRTLEDMYGLSALGSAATATPITDVWGSGTDTTPPTVSASESGTSGTITLSASASDNVGVTKVEFYVDSVLEGTDTTSPYSMTLDSTTLSNASHSLTAKAYDAAGNVGTSSAVSFTINNSTPDTTPPTVSAAESGTNGTITLSATASDNVGVTKVEFYVDSVLQGTDTTSPYSMTLDSTTLSNASHSLTAKAYDAANNVGTSSAVSFTINNTTGNVLQNGVGITIADATVNHQQNWTMVVPAGATNLVFSMSGGTGDADLYVKFGSAPTTSSYDCRPYVTGNNESCPITTAQAGTYYVMVNAYAAYSGVTLKGSYTAPGSGGTPTANFTFTTSGLTATFTDTSTDAGGSIGTHSWNFGDSSTSTAASPSHTYAAAGTYTVTETVADSVNTSATSTKTASVTVSVPTSTQLLGNTGFETGTASPWTATTGVLNNSTSEPAHAGSWDAWLDGYGTATTDTLSQTVTIPAGKTTGALSFYLHIDTAETGTTAYDTLTVQVGSTTVATFSNVNAASGYQLHTYNVSVTAGSSVTIKFTGVEGSTKQTSFVLDDITFTVQ
jgi:PKD repeat protein